MAEPLEAGQVDASSIQAAVVDALASSLCVLDANGTLLWVNQAWRSFSQQNGGTATLTCEGSNYLQACRPAEVEGESIGTATEHETHCAFVEDLRDVLQGRRAHAQTEYPCHSPSEQRWFMVEVIALQGPGQARALVAHHAITLSRLTELRQREELRLQALGTLAGGIAHDFNNLLAVMLAHTRMAADDLATGHGASVHLESVRAAGERATALVAKILAFARGEPSVPRAQDMGPIVRNAVDLFRAGLPPGVRLLAEVEPLPLPAIVDATELTQVVLNLCHNAADALEGGHGTVEVHLSRAPVEPGSAAAVGQDRPGPGLSPLAGCAELVVVDDGAGISDTLRERIFEPFFSTKPRGQGTGLGLAIVHGIVQRHGGRIEVQSRRGQGSRFTVRMPLTDGPLDASDEAAAGEHVVQPSGDGPAESPDRGAAWRVLVVDDDPVVGQMLEALLKRAGHETRRVEDASVVVQLLQDGQRFDALLTDHAMPGMTGIELAALVQQRAVALPVLLMSGSVDGALRRAASACGVHAVLQKERIYDDLLPALKAAVGGSGDPRR